MTPPLHAHAPRGQPWPTNVACPAPVDLTPSPGLGPGPLDHWLDISVYSQSLLYIPREYTSPSTSSLSLCGLGQASLVPPPPDLSKWYKLE